VFSGQHDKTRFQDPGLLSSLQSAPPFFSPLRVYSSTGCFRRPKQAYVSAAGDYSVRVVPMDKDSLIKQFIVLFCRSKSEGMLSLSGDRRRCIPYFNR